MLAILFSKSRIQTSLQHKQKIPPLERDFHRYRFGLAGMLRNNPGCSRHSGALKPAVVHVGADELRDERRVIGQHDAALERFEAKIFHPSTEGTIEEGCGIICVGFGSRCKLRPFGFQRS
jgi:hypothetical protein